MKKILLFVYLVSLLSSCSLTSENYKKREIYIEYIDIFKTSFPHFCYFYLENCSSCALLENKIIDYAESHSDFYIVIPTNKFNYGYDRDANIGIKNYEEIIITGFPSMFYIENQEIKNLYVGIKEITNKLHF